ncbi:hypothetical protein [Chromobacterium sp. IIBBL 290-4]|uniref:hypothetical protein n=1 Tax=Chromobacterium sp. IIBBL 290-4 TaxID=2953890 RepID=UPI0020B80C32|nr:hypothetical protein [Chromobacterium sp. IIBBL 290-4]UTH74595.1 hypothetical protein NKT35_00305 [Chromobacterium sp. IIBBL 290-4]
MSNLTIFLRQVRSRSREHLQAMGLLASARLAGQMVAVLRQELDSMVRVIYLLTQNSERRELLIGASVRGEKWSQEASRAKVTDREMVELAQSLQGWTQAVYKFGCAFIHLSGLHDYNDRDPLSQLPTEERRDILEHCRYYHGGPAAERFEDLVPYLPSILEKIAKNLECYLESLENGEMLDTNDV